MCNIQAKVEEAFDGLTGVIKTNNERLYSMTVLYEQRKELELKLNARQKKMVIFSH